MARREELRLSFNLWRKDYLHLQVPFRFIFHHRPLHQIHRHTHQFHHDHPNQYQYHHLQSLTYCLNHQYHPNLPLHDPHQDKEWSSQRCLNLYQRDLESRTSLDGLDLSMTKSIIQICWYFSHPLTKCLDPTQVSFLRQSIFPNPFNLTLHRPRFILFSRNYHQNLRVHLLPSYLNRTILIWI